MSCIQLDSKHYATAFSGYVSLYCKPYFVKFLGNHILDTEELFLRLIEWNEKAHNERYSGQYNFNLVNILKNEFINKQKNYSPLYPDDDMKEAVRIIKLLQSIDYQCCDSTLYENSDDKKMIKQMIKNLTHFCIYEKLEYSNFEWVM